MTKKHFFIIVDTETTVEDTVVDFGAIVCDRKGRVYKQCAVLVNGIFGEVALFYRNAEKPGSIWSPQGRDARFTAYQNMLEEGTRMMASVAAVNRWLEKVKGEFDPTLTAYNLAFDVGKCANTGIDLSMFSERFCLWHAADAKWGTSKKYLQFVLENHLFNPPTELGNMSYKTKAEIMARFLQGDNSLSEPHTALEDALYFELPILQQLVKSTKREDYMNPKAYNWRSRQVKDWFKPA